MMNFIKKNKYPLVIVLVLLISAIAHATNMFNFPYYENDEAVYISQAWSLLHLGKLAPYTYWYDHAPAGWFLIALWAKLTGGFFIFNVSVNSGRILMLVLHVISTYFVYFIAKRLTNTKIAGIISALFFSLSPLALYFQRRVLLDNIMTFWALFSAVLLLIKPLKLRHIIFSAVCLAIACLSKETAVFFVPAFLYLLFRVAHPRHKTIAIIGWVGVFGLVCSFYVLYALIQSEFFPFGSALGGTTPHVSLLETLKFQGSRPGGSIFYPPDSLFWQNMKRWVGHDPVLMIGGIVSTLFLLYYWIRNKKSLIGFPVLLISFSFFFLMRGGVVIEFYIIPLIPLLSLSIGLVTTYFISMARKNDLVQRYSYNPLIIPVACAGIIIFGYLLLGKNYEGFNVYTANQTRAQLQALEWIRENAEPNDYIVTDNYLWLDLNDPKNPSGKVFPNAEWYWKVERDPEIKNGMFGGVPDKIDYVIQTPQVVIDTRTSDFKLIAKTLDQSKPIISFDSDNWSVIIWGQRNPDKIIKRSWNDYKQNFIEESGRVLDLERPNTYTSQAQSYALLRAVWMNDKETFDKVLKWSETNLQYENGTFRGVYNPSDTSLVSFTDADEDIALSLIFASKQWHDDVYVQKAQHVLTGMWNEDIATYKGTPYVSAGNWAEHGSGITINPSYLSPAWYRIFADFDHTHPWSDIIDSSYSLLQRCTSINNGVLPADWCNLSTVDGSVELSLAPQPTSSDYSIDAYRTPWRIALDYMWFKRPRAKEYLSSLSFLSREYSNRGLLYTSYTHTGSPRERYETASMYGGTLGYYLVNDPALADQIYKNKIEPLFYEDVSRSYWQVPNNYYSQNWAWFGTALYGNLLPNLWGEI